MTTRMRMGWVLAAALAGVAPLMAGDSAQEILQNVKKTFDGVNDAKLTFAQKTKFALTRLEQTSTGTLYMRKGDHYRIELEEQTVATDGVTVWSYSRANNQLLIDTYRKTDRGFSPERLLAGDTGNLSSTIIGNEKLGKVETVVLKLTPKTDRSSITSLRLWIDNNDWIVRKAEVVDAGGKQTTYTIGEYRFNKGVADSLFTLTAPPGADVVDLR
jgi:outer membrane lipoprotein carrier protein